MTERPWRPKRDRTAEDWEDMLNRARAERFEAQEVVDRVTGLAMRTYLQKGDSVQLSVLLDYLEITPEQLENFVRLVRSQ